MWHDLGIAEKDFFQGLVEADEQLAARVWASGCSCGGRLDRADYPRKARGIPEEWDDLFSRRISFCCCKEGCRRRKTPPSVRFFGRRVYVAAVILAVCARWVSARRAEVRRRTKRRWLAWFRTDFVGSRFWQGQSARLMPPVADDELPASLLSRFSGGRASVLDSTLSFLSPMTTKSAAEVMVG